MRSDQPKNGGEGKDLGILYQAARDQLDDATEILKRADSSSQESITDYLDLVHKISTLDADYLLYLGSGVTKSAVADTVPGGLEFSPPTWIELLNRLLDSWASTPAEKKQKLREWAARGHTSKEEITEAQHLLEGFDKLDLAKRIGDLFPTKDVRNDHIRELVQPAPSLTVRSPLLEQIIRLPSSAVVTTNYDDIIERFIRRRIGPSRNRERERAAPHSVSEGPSDDEDYLQRRLFLEVHAIYNDDSLTYAYGRPGVRLFYLHGSLVHKVAGNRYNIVFDRYEYAALSQRGSRIFDHVRHLMESMPAIYIGFGLDDPSFNLIEDSRARLDHNSPHSYAFVPSATDDERASWEQRNLHLIPYGRDHADLVTLIKAIADIRKFLCWAEPDRSSDGTRNADRTAGYLVRSLCGYADEDFEGAVKDGRAALATTLFWPQLKENPNKASLLRQVDIRARLGLSHYKQRYLVGFPQALHRADINAEAATKILDAIGSPESVDSAQACSLKILKARLEYANGKFKKAQTLYQDVISITKSVAEKILDALPCALTYDNVIYVQCYAYAVCQFHRIEYQHKPRDPRSVAAALEKLGNDLDKLANGNWKLAGKASNDALEEYFKSSLTTIRLMALWFSGRQLVGSFGDLIPTLEERRAPNSMIVVGKAIELLMQSPQPRDGRDEPDKISRRWEALRYRYLARAQALHWFLKNFASHSDKTLAESEEPRDFANALGAASKALDIVSEPNLLRERIVTHQEIARIAIIFSYGSRIRTRGRAAPMYSLYTAINHLAESSTLIKLLHERDVNDRPRAMARGERRPPSSGRNDLREELVFLKALTVRMQGYIRLLCRGRERALSGMLPPVGRQQGERERIAEKSGVRKKDVHRIARYGLLEAVELLTKVDAESFQRRVEKLVTTFTELESELDDLSSAHQ